MDSIPNEVVIEEKDLTNEVAHFRVIGSNDEIRVPVWAVESEGEIEVARANLTTAARVSGLTPYCIQVVRVNETNLVGVVCTDQGLGAIISPQAPTS
jgi:hypothetical protein